jgi:hypothetical protein
VLLSFHRAAASSWASAVHAAQQGRYACFWGFSLTLLHPEHSLLFLGSKGSNSRGGSSVRVAPAVCAHCRPSLPVVLAAALLLLLLCMDAPRLCVQELVTILWSLAQLHHQPDPEWMSIFLEAAEVHLPGLTGGQLAQMGYGLGQLGIEPPARWMETFLSQVGVYLCVCGGGGSICGVLCLESWLLRMHAESCRRVSRCGSAVWVRGARPSALHMRSWQPVSDGCAAASRTAAAAAAVVSSGDGSRRREWA